MRLLSFFLPLAAIYDARCSAGHARHACGAQYRLRGLSVDGAGSDLHVARPRTGQQPWTDGASSATTAAAAATAAATSSSESRTVARSAALFDGSNADGKPSAAHLPDCRYVWY